MQQLQTAVRSAAPDAAIAPQVAVVGLGYVGLPTSLALAEAGFGILGIDVSERRIHDIRQRHVDILPDDHRRLEAALENPQVILTPDARALRSADAILICVPTPIDADHQPDLRLLRSACASVVAGARPGQVLILTSTSHVGATRELLVEPLAARGLIAGHNVNVVFSPERIDPGNLRNPQHKVPRVLGGVTPDCADAAIPYLGEIAEQVVVVSSPETAELCKLYENTFRAVNVALANELADVARAHELDAVEVVEAAATKPYGFMPFFPGPGVGGHCIPCDPHYLLEPLDRLGARAPLVREAMRAIHARPRRVVARAVEVLAGDGICINEARVLLVGLAYKSGIADLRESPALEMFERLRALRATVDYYDPYVSSVIAEDGLSVLSVQKPDPHRYDLVIVATLHPQCELDWLDESARVLDCTYRLARGRARHLV